MKVIVIFEKQWGVTATIWIELRNCDEGISFKQFDVQIFKLVITKFRRRWVACGLKG
jgi:hypothetical protein